MTVLDLCQGFKLTSVNSQKDLMGLIVKLSRSSQRQACALVGGGGVGGVIVFAGGDFLWKG